ncbi:uncharacterized protein LOC117124631 [Anneissia japonica]|uniref:uncharacterized protein LOC117124631 n=1 Tax=Anneissia japonica TaxID=1529436 RepID=UPI0014257CBA|nr:uncharacterized protein LOC117124631 [Anneissia japonica]
MAEKRKTRSSTLEKTHNWSCGDQVLCKWHDTKYYKATIVAVANEKVTVVYECDQQKHTFDILWTEKEGGGDYSHSFVADSKNCSSEEFLPDPVPSSKDEGDDDSHSFVADSEECSSEEEFLPDSNPSSKVKKCGINVNSEKSKSEVYVETTHNTSSCRSYDKVAYCLFCSKSQKKLPVHLLQHKNEIIVSQYLAAFGSRRQALLTYIRNKGNHQHNYKVLEEGKGDLIVVYRPSEYRNPANYQPCSNCLGYLSKCEMWKHNCKLDSSQNSRNNDKKKAPHVKQGKLLLPPPKSVEAGTIVHELISNMRSDDITQCIKGDNLILC